MQFPIFKLQPDEVATIWAILRRYPSALAYRYSITVKIFGISIHPSVGVKGLLVDLIGAPPA